jgi:hypothetical protein
MINNFLFQNAQFGQYGNFQIPNITPGFGVGLFGQGFGNGNILNTSIFPSLGNINKS